MDVNEGFEVNTGYTWAEVVGKTSQELNMWVDLTDRELMLQEVKKHGRIYNLEVKFRTKHGKIIDGLMSVRLISLNNEPHLLSVAKDITAWNRTKAELIHHNHRLELLNRIIAASAANPDPNLILENTCQELGRAFNAEQVTAKLFRENKTAMLVAAEYRANEWPSTLNQLLPLAENPAVQYLLKTKVPLIISDTGPDVRLAPIKLWLKTQNIAAMLLLPIIADGDVMGVLQMDFGPPRHFSSEEVSLAWSVADQLAGSMARSMLHEEYRLLSAAIEQSVDSIIVTDNQGLILYVNPAFERITHHKRAEVAGKSLFSFIVPLPNHRALLETIQKTIGQGQLWHGRITSQHPDGAQYTQETTITPVKDRQGNIINFVATQRDVTRELSLEKQYQQSQKMEAIGQLTAGIAHDFNNLLMAINGFAELMQLRLPPDSPFQDMAGRIVDSGESAANLIRQLLIFSRKQIVEPQVVNLNQTITDIDKMLRRIIGENIALEIVLDSNLGSTKIDPTQFEQVIINLAVNARDAMPNGGTLTIVTKNTRLTEQSLIDVAPGEYLLFSMNDTGAGMSEAVQSHIFEPFFTTKEQGKGTGLGLSTVYGIVKQCNGTIQVSSQEGLGTTFTIYLPRVATPSQDSPVKHVSDRSQYGTETILLVGGQLGGAGVGHHVSANPRLPHPHRQ